MSGFIFGVAFGTEARASSKKLLKTQRIVSFDGGPRSLHSVEREPGARSRLSVGITRVIAQFAKRRRIRVQDRRSVFGDKPPPTCWLRSARCGPHSHEREHHSQQQGASFVRDLDGPSSLVGWVHVADGSRDKAQGVQMGTSKRGQLCPLVVVDNSVS